MKLIEIKQRSASIPQKITTFVIDKSIAIFHFRIHEQNYPTPLFTTPGVFRFGPTDQAHKWFVCGIIQRTNIFDACIR
jgi:hypothetical protein